MGRGDLYKDNENIDIFCTNSVVQSAKNVPANFLNLIKIIEDKECN